ncbi:Addiction module antidote protein [Lysobacter dokdonensis DS-58]|uniref:Addiction module antidote protein n=1 Tax=Lysobacter dokdonensis DS-58 TaxID=1300345 RepID=A0A0A2WLT1_9GAMM|nr:addiction module antidote protein [Lysobacter dokdonensis]KGQ19215.1 Addiction module antidote protein [Lysobacter dokdonensis DS-58]
MTSNSLKLQTTPFDVVRHLASDGMMASYLTACYEEGGTALFLKAIGEVARARGMSEVANNTGLTRASLYKALAEDGNPAFDTLVRVLDTLGFRMRIEPITPDAPVVRDMHAAPGRVRVMEQRTEYNLRPAAKTPAKARKATKKAAAKKR